jgi:hypothetical protein
MANKTWIGLSTLGDYSVAANWSPTGVPGAADKVHLPPGAPPITAGLNQSAIALAEFVCESGNTGAAGSAAAYLQINTPIFRWSGAGVAYIDLGATAVSPDVLGAAQAGTGTHGLYLKGTAIGVVNVIDGNVGLAAIFGETSTAATVRSVGAGASVTVGAGVTLTNYYQTEGTGTVHCAVTGVTTVYGGTLTLLDAGAVASLVVNGGEVLPNSSGTIAAAVCNGGTTDWTTSGETRIVSSLQINPGATVVIDFNVLTVTAIIAPVAPVRYLAQTV